LAYALSVDECSASPPRRLAPADKAPEAIIYLSYYAMLHAAAAVLIERIGRAPKTHGAIIGQFSNLTKADGGKAAP